MSDSSRCIHLPEGAVLCAERFASSLSPKSTEDIIITSATTQNAPNVVYGVVRGWYSPRQTRPMHTKAAVRKENNRRHAQGSARPLSTPFLHAAYSPARASNNTTAPARRTNIRLSRTGKPRPYRIAKHSHNKQPHLNQCLPGTLPQLLERAERWRNALMPIGISRSRRILIQAVKIRAPRRADQGRSSSPQTSA